MVRARQAVGHPRAGAMGEQEPAETRRAARPRLAARRRAQGSADQATRAATPPVEAEGREEGVSAFVSHMFSSGGAALVLVVGALWIWRRPGSSPARRWLIAGALVVAGAQLLRAELRHRPAALSPAFGRSHTPRFPQARPRSSSSARALIRRGTGTMTRFPVLDRASAARVLEAIRVFKMTDAAWIIASGGLLRPTEFDEPNGRTMRDALVRSGVPALASAPRNRVQEYP